MGSLGPSLLKPGSLFLASLVAGTATFSAVSSRAGSEPASQPLHLQELPARAFLQFQDSTFSYLFLQPDGSQVRLNQSKAILEIQKLGQSNQILLPTSIPALRARTDQVWLLQGVTAGKKKQVIVHLPSGKLYDKVDDRVDIESLAGGTLVASSEKIEWIHPLTGELQWLSDRTQVSSSPPRSSVTTFGTALTVDGQVFVFDDQLQKWRPVRFPVAGYARDCDSMGRPHAITCRIGARSFIVFKAGGELKVIDSTEKVILALDLQQQKMIWNPSEVAPGEPSLAKSQIMDLREGRVAKFIAGPENRENPLRTLFGFSNGQFMVWFKDGDLRVVDNAEFWWAYRQGDFSLLRKGQLMGRYSTVADVVPILLREIRSQFNDNPAGPWQYSIADGTLVYSRTAGAENRVFIGSDPFARWIENTDFLHLQFQSGSNVFHVLYDMLEHRAYEAGSGSIRFLASRRGDFLLLSKGREQWLLSVNEIRRKTSWRESLQDSVPRPELSTESLAACAIPSANLTQNSLASTLFKMRGGVMETTEAALRNLIGYRLNRGEHTLLVHVLQQWIARDVMQFRLAFRRLDLYERLRSQETQWTESPCLTPDQKQALKQQVKQIFAETADADLVGTDFYSYQHLIVLQPLLKKFGFSDPVSEDIVISKLAKAAEMHPQLTRVFPSKLYYFATAVMAPIFGKPVQFKTDVTVTQDKKVLHLILMSSLPAHGQMIHRNSFGFYHGMMDSFVIPGEVGTRVQRQLQWLARGQKFAGEVTITKSGNLRHLVPSVASLDYKTILRDRQLSGMMVVGSNLGRMATGKTLYSYQSFFRDQGFQFDDPVDAPNALELMKQKIVSGELDYLIKEAHSDGDEKNLFRSSRNGLLIRGHKTDEKGQAFVIYLLAPNYATSGASEGSERDSDLIPNQLFGEWIRQREADGQGPLVYVNASCTSDDKVVNEITAAHSPLLVPLPSLTSVSPFGNSDKNAVANLIKGILAGQTWAQIRERMNSDVKVKNQMLDLFALPNEDNFETRIRQALDDSFDIHILLRDLKLNRSFSIDEFNHL